MSCKRQWTQQSSEPTDHCHCRPCISWLSTRARILSRVHRDVKQAVAAATSLKASAMVLARGKQGSRISDSAQNIFGDEETVWACGYVDGQEVGYMYMGVDPD